MTDPTTGGVAVTLIPTEGGNRSYIVTITPDATQPFATKTLTINVATAGYGPASRWRCARSSRGRSSTPTAIRCAA